MKTILVVDDDHTIVHMLRMALEQEGYNVLSGYDGFMAIYLARTRKPDLIIMDVDMPMANGAMALKTLREQNETKSIPVIFSTGIASAKIYPLVEQHQRVAHLKKPIDLEHLLEMVKMFLQDFPVSVF